MRIMAIGLFFSCVNNSLSANYLILLGKEKLVRNMGFINLIFGLSLYLLAIKFYGLLGVAIIGVAISMLNTMVFSIYTIMIKRQRSKQSIILTSCWLWSAENHQLYLSFWYSLSLVSCLLLKICGEHRIVSCLFYFPLCGVGVCHLSSHLPTIIV